MKKNPAPPAKRDALGARTAQQTSEPSSRVSPRWLWRLGSERVPQTIDELFAIMLELRGVQ